MPKPDRRKKLTNVKNVQKDMYIYEKLCRSHQHLCSTKCTQTNTSNINLLPTVCYFMYLFICLMFFQHNNHNFTHKHHHTNVHFYLFGSGELNLCLEIILRSIFRIIVET